MRHIETNKPVHHLSENTKNQRDLLVKQVRLWGDLNTDAILDPRCQTFTFPGIKGLIGYRIESNCAIVFGDPICAPADKLPLAQAFDNYCREKSLKVVYAIASAGFSDLAMQGCCNVSIQFGHKLIIDPSSNPLEKTGSKGVLLRKKVKHASNEGITVKEYIPHDPQMELAIEHIGSAWLQARRGPQVYISHLSFFNDREGKRWFYAQKDGHIVGILLLNEIQASAGWLLNNLILTANAPNGTSELLITSAFKALEAEKCSFVAIGPVTTKKLDNIVGLGTVSTWLIKAVFNLSKRVFRLDGQTLFWEKFQPENEPSYLLFKDLDFSSIKALMLAMNVKI